MNRWITIPRPVNVKGILNGIDELDFSSYFVELVLPRLPRKTVEEIRVVRELVAALAECKALEIKKISEDAHKALVKWLPDNLVGRLVARVVDFDDAIVSADDDAQHARRTDGKAAADLMKADPRANYVGDLPEDEPAEQPSAN